MRKPIEKLLALLMVFCMALTAGVAQSIAALPDSIRPIHLELEYQLGLESNAITNSFTNKLINGSFLDSSLLRQVSSGLPEKGLAGYFNRASARVFVHTSTDSTRSQGYYIGINHFDLAELRFKPQLFNLVFFGNQETAGQSLDLGGTYLRQTSTQTLHAGLYRNYTDSLGRKLLLGLHLNLIKGQYLHELSVKSGSLFTAVAGDEILLDMNYDYSRSDTEHTRFGDMNGYGLGLGFTTHYQRPNGFGIRFDMHNLGAVRWVNNRHNFHKDSSLTFEGWEIDNILNIRPDEFDNAGTDSLWQVLSSETLNSTRWAMEPCHVRMQVQIPLGKDQVWLNLSAEHLFFTSAMPYLSFGPEFRLLQDRWMIRPYFMSGGYGTRNAGLITEIALDNTLRISAGCHAIDALIFPDKQMGQSFYLKASYSFKKKVS